MTSRSNRITYIARTNHRNAGLPFGIREEDRRSHVYVCGKTGTGKSTLLRTMIAQDIRAGVGCALFDPHGDLSRAVLTLVPRDVSHRLVYMNAADPALPWRFNPFGAVAESARARAVAGMIEVLKKLWPDEWGPRLEHLFRNVAFTLLEAGGASFADIPALLTDRAYRSRVVASLEDPVVRHFWKEEYERYSPGFRSVVVAPLQNKVGALLTDPLLRRILTEPGTPLDLPAILAEGRILIVNLDKGAIGEGPSTLLGSLLVSSLALAALERSGIPADARRSFLVYLDEFASFTTLALVNMLAELRKYGVGMVLAHQHLAQLSPDLRDAVFGNVGTILSFRVGGADATYLARELSPAFSPDDLTSLQRFEVYVRLLIENSVSRPFSARTFASLDEIPGWSNLPDSRLVS